LEDECILWGCVLEGDSWDWGKRGGGCMTWLCVLGCGGAGVVCVCVCVWGGGGNTSAATLSCSPGSPSIMEAQSGHLCWMPWSDHHETCNTRVPSLPIMQHKYTRDTFVGEQEGGLGVWMAGAVYNGCVVCRCQQAR